MKANNPDLSHLPSIFRKYPGIDAVYLFGSYARGEQRDDSDIDLGIVSSSAELRNRKLDILAELAAAGYCRVDLVFLPSGKILLDHEIVSTHHLVYHKPEFDHPALFSLVTRMYLDFKPYLRVQREALKKRLQEWSDER